MKLRWIFWLISAVFIGFSFPVWGAVPSVTKAEFLKVRLASFSRQVELSGATLSFQNMQKKYQSVAVSKNSRAEVRLMEKAGKNFWLLRINNKDPEYFVTDKYLMIQGEGLRMGPQALPSRVLLSVNKKQDIDVVGVVPVEDYVLGVLASEMPLSWPLETLKAQAVAARSYALATKQERLTQTYHLESSILDQVFRHVDLEDRKSNLYQKALRAVQETRGMILQGPRHEVLKAYYHADCGGQTTTAAKVWKGGVNSGVVQDRSCPSNPRAHWSFLASKSEIGKRFGVTDLLELQVVKVASEQRVQYLRLKSASGSSKVISANDFRQAFGFQNIRSALFEVKEKDDSFEFHGRGFGHGVGLCQWGSRVLGQKGKSFRQILKHYYPLAKL